MRLPFPERVTLWRVGVFAIIIALVQQLYGTAIGFSILSIVYILLSAIAFNIAGGFRRPSGAYIAFNSLLGVTIGLLAKDLLGERGDSNLQAGTKTLAVYAFGMVGMITAAFLTRRLSAKKGFLQDMVVGDNLRRSAIGCLAGGIFLQLFGYLLGGGDGSIGSALSQLNRLIAMSIILGVTYEIQASGGRRSMNVTVLTAMGWLFLFGGLLGFSKEGFFLPLLAWLLPASALRYRIPNYQVVIAALMLAFTVYYLVPYAQYGRNSRSQITSTGVGLQVAFAYLSDLEGTRKLYLEDLKNQETASGPNVTHYFDKDEGILDRLNIIPIDDALISYTDDDHVFGLYPMYVNLTNTIPHFLWKNKPFFGQGNAYAHELGIISPDDFSTGISFSPTADAYHEAKWLGVAFAATLTWFLFFVIADSVAGDVSKSPWGLLLFSLMSHAASEGLLAGAFYQMSYGTLTIIFCAFFSAYVTPLLGAVLIGSARTKPTRIAPIRSIAGRNLPLR